MCYLFYLQNLMPCFSEGRKLCLSWNQQFWSACVYFFFFRGLFEAITNEMYWILNFFSFCCLNSNLGIRMHVVNNCNIFMKFHPLTISLWNHPSSFVPFSFLAGWYVKMSSRGFKEKKPRRKKEAFWSSLIWGMEEK